MGLLIEGVWKDVPRDTRKTGGEFIRPESGFRDRVSADGSSGFKAEAGRYHLYVSLACPWAHRTIIFRKLKGLEKAISMSVVDPLMGENGWVFSERPGCIPDTANGASFLYEIYLKARPGFSGRVTVPTLWDKAKQTIVNNESPEIIRMLNSEFDDLVEKSALKPLPDMYPQALRPEIDRWNELIYRTVNNGVYRAGFATAQDKYERAVGELFATLDVLERHLAQSRYLCGERMTEADWRLFTTLVRFEPVYHFHFKCNLRRLRDYPSLWAFTRELYQTPGVASTVDLWHIKEHYYRSQKEVNPSQVVPVGPILNYDEPHGRGKSSDATAGS
ncbi:MAG: glutathione S-transferase family protein [Burkholderiales bacterium]